jgi:hypothetical protein
MAGDCKGWGIEAWGKGPWGSVDAYAPSVLSIDPPCGSIDILPCLPIVLTVVDAGCSGLDLDCTRIYINDVLIYDGTGLSFGAGTENDGWISPCEGDSTVTRVADATYGYIYTFRIVCDCFQCETRVTIVATFCDINGNTFEYNCYFDIVNCNYITGIEIIDKRRFLLRFKNKLKGDVSINPDLYDVQTYRVLPVSLGIISGDQPVIRAILVEKSLFPQHVIMELDNTIDGAAYQFNASPNILDIYGSTLQERGFGIAISRKTKVDFIASRIPQIYNRTITVNEETFLSPYHILAAIGIEDERSGGDF